MIMKKRKINSFYIIGYPTVYFPRQKRLSCENFRFQLLCAVLNASNIPYNHATLPHLFFPSSSNTYDQYYTENINQTFLVDSYHAFIIFKTFNIAYQSLSFFYVSSFVCCLHLQIELSIFIQKNNYDLYIYTYFRDNFINANSIFNIKNYSYCL